MRDFANLQHEFRLEGIGLQANWLQRRIAEACLALALSPALTWMRPFGVDEQTFLIRLAYWGGLLVCWFLAMAAVEALLADRRLSRGLGPLARRAVVILLAALPMLVIAGAATHLLTGWQADPAKVAAMYFKVVVIGATATLLAKAILPWSTEPAPVEAPRHAPMADLSSAGSSPLVARLPLAMRGRIVCLEMEDHYVRVHTDRGSALVLMRLSDAIAEAHPVQGRQVHRSWWVSDEAVEGFERVGRVGAVRLSNGARAPVSQRYLRSVEASFC